MAWGVQNLISTQLHAILDRHAHAGRRGRHLREPLFGARRRRLQSGIQAEELRVEPVLFVDNHAPVGRISQEVVPEVLGEGQRQRRLHGEVIGAPVDVVGAPPV